MRGPGLLPAVTSCLFFSNILPNSLCSQICCTFKRSQLLFIPFTSPHIRIYHEYSSNIRSSLFSHTRTMLVTPLSHQFPRAFEKPQFTSIFNVARSVRNSRHVVSSGKSEDEATTASRSNPNSHTTLASLHTHTLEVKRSKFIAVAAPVDSEDSALSFLSQVRDTSASHNCWAFKIGERLRFSDDGEPGGTAGRPILSAITSSGLDHVIVVVTRFFGGTKLGTGGLVRAYGRVTMECLKDTATITVKAKVPMKIRVPYDVLGVLYPLLQAYEVEKVEEHFDTVGEGGVVMDLLVDVENAQLLEKELEITCNGRASVSCTEQSSA